MESTHRIFKSINPSALVAGPALLVAAPCLASPSTPATEVTPIATSDSTQTSAVVPTPTRARAVVSFASDILPVFDQSCLKYHRGDKTEKGLSVKSYAALMQGSEKGAVVVPGDPDASRLAQLLLNGKMPKRGPKLSQGQIELVLEWIRAGAQIN